MSIYKISFKQLRQEAKLSEMLSALERGLKKFDIDFYLVGAVARDVWMSAIHGIPPSRITGDIDFAVFINDKGTYEALKKYLIETEGFHPYKGNAFVLVWNGFIQVDLLPFGEIEGKGAHVKVEGTGLTDVSVPGFKEIYDFGLPEAELEGKHHFKFCTLPGIVLLKLMAYEDRPEIRRDDIKDISKILKHFFDMYAEEIYANHLDLFGQDQELHMIAARVMGRDMAKIARLNKELFGRISALLDKNTVNPATSDVSKIMAEFFDNTVQDSMDMLIEIKVGFME